MRATILLFVFGLWMSMAQAKDCEFKKNIERTVDIADATVVTVEAGAGELIIRGEPGRKEVLVIAKICASEQDSLDQMDVRSEVKSGAASFVTQFPDRSMWGTGDRYARIDLSLTVPAAAKLDVTDSSGAAVVENVAELAMTDSSGELQIAKVRGNVSVVDSSGELGVKDVGGDVEITDSSGSINVKHVKGSLIVLSDSSGGIKASDIGKHVLVKRDSSGSIEVSDVAGDFTVLKDSSGGVSHKNVGGAVNIPD